MRKPCLHTNPAQQVEEKDKRRHQQKPLVSIDARTHTHTHKINGCKNESLKIAQVPLNPPSKTCKQVIEIPKLLQDRCLFKQCSGLLLGLLVHRSSSRRHFIFRHLQLSERWYGGTDVEPRALKLTGRSWSPSQRKQLSVGQLRGSHAPVDSPCTASAPALLSISVCQMTKNCNFSSVVFLLCSAG